MASEAMSGVRQKASLGAPLVATEAPRGGHEAALNRFRWALNLEATCAKVIRQIDLNQGPIGTRLRELFDCAALKY